MIRNLFRVSLFMLAMSQVACDILSNNTIASNNNTNVGTIGSAAGNNPGVGVPVPVTTSTGTTPAPNGFFPVVVNKGMPTVVGTSAAEPEKIEIGVAKIADDQSIQEHAQYVRESLESFGYVPPEKAAPSATVVEPPNGVKGTAAATLPAAALPAATPRARKPASVPLPVVVPPSVPILASGGTRIAR